MWAENTFLCHALDLYYAFGQAQSVFPDLDLWVCACLKYCFWGPLCLCWVIVVVGAKWPAHYAS